MLRLPEKANEAQIKAMAESCTLHELCTAEHRTRSTLFAYIEEELPERRFYLAAAADAVAALDEAGVVEPNPEEGASGFEVREAVQLYDAYGPNAEDRTKRDQLKDITAEVMAEKAEAERQARAEAKAAAEAAAKAEAEDIAAAGEAFDAVEKAEAPAAPTE